MQLKPGVRLNGIKPELLVAMMAADGMHTEAGYQMVVTSVTEGKHARASKHYTGCAFDLRISHLADGVSKNITNRLTFALGSDFDVILESDHIHVEYDPKDALTS